MVPPCTGAKLQKGKQAKVDFNAIIVVNTNIFESVR